MTSYGPLAPITPITPTAPAGPSPSAPSVPEAPDLPPAAGPYPPAAGPYPPTRSEPDSPVLPPDADTYPPARSEEPDAPDLPPAAGPVGDEPPPPPPGPPSGGDGGRRLGGRGLLAAVLAGALGAAAVVVPTTLLGDTEAEGTQTVASQDAAPVLTETTGETPISAIAREVSPSVARVDAQTGLGAGTGSAVIYDSDGTLITNAHVVGDASTVNITLPDGGRHTAEVVGSDPRSDLAVLRVDDADLPVPRWADAPGESASAASVSVGDPVVAIGSPFGLDGTVTAGIISAVGRTVPTSPQESLVDLLQTDAAINPGNSGGALADASGRIIGVNTAIVSRSGGNDGVGFAIPASTVHSVAGQLLTTGRVQHAELGIAGQTVDPDVAALYGLDVDAGAVIGDVREGGPADQAGIAPGDIVVAVDGTPIRSISELVAQIQQRRPGDEVELTLVRGGEQQTVTAELAERA